ncbi:MAG: cation:proton antiporter, partial [Nitratireductor sp.]
MPYIREVIIFLIAAVMVMPLFHYVRASTVLGYLVIGALIGPHGLAIIQSSDGIAALGELGVVFLLFTIGLELSWTRLRAMRTLVLGLGGAQVMLSGIVLTGVFMLFGVPGAGATVIGFALALSSTAIVTQLLIERGEFASRSGQISFSILLMQDLAVVPLLVMVTILADVASGEDVNIFMLALFATLKAVVAVALIVTVGRYVLSTAYRFITWTRNPELFLALSLLAALLTAVATGSAGLSMALGAFLGGLLLSDTEFRHQVESDIQPFKGLLLGLFFISVGVGMDFGVLADNYGLVFGILGAFLVIKSLLVGGLALAFGQSRICWVRAALLLASGGEFAFVVISSATADGVVSASVAQPVQLATAISMALT